MGVCIFLIYLHLPHSATLGISAQLKILSTLLSLFQQIFLSVFNVYIIVSFWGKIFKTITEMRFLLSVYTYKLMFFSPEIQISNCWSIKNDAEKNLVPP